MNATLLAIDLGVRAGFALYGQDGRLRWYRSRNFGSRARLKQAAFEILRDLDGLACIVLEGDRTLGAIWERAAKRVNVNVRYVPAEVWRERLLYSREQRSGSDAKRHAGRLARAVIDWSGAPKATSLRHDAAEAILIGLWGVLERGWLPSVPSELRKLT